MIDKVKEEIIRLSTTNWCGTDPAFCHIADSINCEECYANHILEIPTIAKALDLYQKALDGKLVELDENQNCKIQRLGSEEYEDTTFTVLYDNVRRVKELNIE